MPYATLEPGDPAPWFMQDLFDGRPFTLEKNAGRWIVLGFLDPVNREADRSRLAALSSRIGSFNSNKTIFLGVVQPQPEAAAKRIARDLPNMPLIADQGGRISRAYGALPSGKASQSPGQSRGFWIILDAALRVHAKLPLQSDGGDLDQLLATVEALPRPGTIMGIEPPVPVMMIPNVFDAEFCRKLIALHDEHGGRSTGVMRPVDGKVVEVKDPSFKVRKDYTITDEAVIRQTQNSIRRRVAPEIFKIHHFRATRMERYIVCCYAAEDGAHFRPHRDNTTKATEHRRFAVSINLNDDFEGGEVGFPEYGDRRFKAPAGAAVVFSCPLLHWVSPVTSGRRYVFLPFLYDDEGAKLRERNNVFKGEGVAKYKMEPSSSPSGP